LYAAWQAVTGLGGELAQLCEALCKERGAHVKALADPRGRKLICGSGLVGWREKNQMERRTGGSGYHHQKCAETERGVYAASRGTTLRRRGNPKKQEIADGEAA